MKAYILFCFIFFFTFAARPCANFSGSGTKLNGTRAPGSRAFGWMLLRHALNKNMQPDGIQLEAQLRGSTNFNDRSDYSVALMYLGRSNEAVELLQRLEAEQPGQYFVAANLGTAYELTGKNEEALRWNPRRTGSTFNETL
jgi:hypothetical protein